MKLWRSVIDAELKAEREAQGLRPNERIPDGIIIGEIQELADPNRHPPADAAIPAPRRDLVRTWIKQRLEGRLDTEEERHRLALELAPTDDAAPPLQIPVGLDSSGESVRKGVERQRREAGEKKR